jgi:hypothetical protein
MLSYEIDGSILTLRATGRVTHLERVPVFDAVRADANVPNNALLLIDFTKAHALTSPYAVIERLRILVDQLGPKLGRLCAMIVPPALAAQGASFQTEAQAFGLRVAIFCDERSARQWLTGREMTSLQWHIGARR